MHQALTGELVGCNDVGRLVGCHNNEDCMVKSKKSQAVNKMNPNDASTMHNRTLTLSVGGWVVG